MSRITQGPLVAALLILGAAAFLFAWRSFLLLYRDFRPGYRGRHRHRRRSRAAPAPPP